MKPYGYIALLLLTANHAYSQLGYVWYKTIPSDYLWNAIDSYKDTGFVVSSVKSISGSSSYGSASVQFIDQEGNVVLSKPTNPRQNLISWSAHPLKSMDRTVATAGSLELEVSHGCETNLLHSGLCSPGQSFIRFQNGVYDYAQYPYSISIGNENLYYVSGERHRSSVPSQCYSDSIHRFVSAYNRAGDLLWQRAYALRRPLFSNFFLSSTLLPYAEDKLISYGRCDSLIPTYNLYVPIPGFLKIDAVTGDSLSFFKLDLNTNSDTSFMFNMGLSVGNMALTKDHQLAFCGIRDTVYHSYINGNPFVGLCDLDGHLKWFKPLAPDSNASNVRVLSLAGGNVVCVFSDRTKFKFWIYLFDADGNLLSKRDVQNPSVFDFPYRFSDALLTEQGDLIIIGNTSVQYPNNSYGMGDPFIAKVANIGIPYRNPWEGHMTDVAALYEQPFILFPNPTSGATTIKTGRDGTLTVYTTLGQVVWTGEVRHFEQQIDFSGLASGLYLYDFYTKNASRKVFGKFIKQ